MGNFRSLADYGKPYSMNEADELAKEQEEEAKHQEYQAEEDKVIAHECVHMGAGGGLCGCVSYTYEMKDNGKSYIVAGEVPISLPTDFSDPEQMARNMDIIIASALAPSDPSGQDLSVASEARGKSEEAKSKILEKNKLEETDSDINGFKDASEALTKGVSALDEQPVA